MKPGVAFRRVCALAAWLALSSAACGGSKPVAAKPPKPALSGSIAAQTELRALLQRFANAAPAERIALKPALAAFRKHNAGDDLARVADVHLAWIALDQGDLAYAQALASFVEKLGPGSTSDAARVVRGAALRREGKAKPAFGALRSLVGKVIDPYVRALLNEEVVAAAMDSSAWPAALELMSAWLRDASDDERPAARKKMSELLAKVPVDHLKQALRAQQAAAAGDASPEVDLRTLLAERLAMIARERHDVRLAQDLLATSGPLLGPQGDAIAQLAAGAGTARVEAPTVGLLLSAGTSEARRRGLEIAAGVTHGLGLPGSRARLVSRDAGGDGERIDDALAALTAEGAAVLIAGATQDEATAAAAFAKAQAVPVLLLHPPASGAPAGGFVFVVGEAPSRGVAELVEALAERGAKPVAVVGGATGSPAADALVAIALSCDDPLDARAFRAARIQGLVLGGDAPCAERALAAAPRPLRVALGLEAAAAGPPAGALVATAGRFPLVAEAPKRAAAAPPPAPPDATAEALDAWLATHAAPPSFWAALGRDAGVLAWAGVRDLPALGTEAPAEVKARRQAAAKSLASAAVDLWTTSVRGFGGQRTLARTIGVREIAKAR